MVPRHFNLDEYNYSAKRCALTGRSYTTTTTTTMAQCRDPVVHKICIRKLDRYLLIMNNNVSEKCSLEKTLSTLIRRVKQLSILFLMLNIFSTGYQNLPFST